MTAEGMNCSDLELMAARPYHARLDEVNFLVRSYSTLNHPIMGSACTTTSYLYRPLIRCCRRSHCHCNRSNSHHTQGHKLLAQISSSNRINRRHNVAKMWNRGDTPKEEMHFGMSNRKSSKEEDKAKQRSSSHIIRVTLVSWARLFVE